MSTENTLVSFRIICHYCGNDCRCPVPLGLKESDAHQYICAKCEAHLGEFVNSEVIQ